MKNGLIKGITYAFMVMLISVVCKKVLKKDILNS